jgi:sarcosine oxidase
VLGLERFDIPNAMGSSHGETRMIRLAYFEGAAYVPLVRRAHRLWQELGTEAGETLLHVTGTLDLAPEGAGIVEASRESCELNDLPFEHFDGAALARRWPQFALPGGYAGLLQPDGGFVASERGIVVQAALAMAAGAEIRAQERVLAFEPTASGGVSVTTERGCYEAGALVLSPGGWMARFVPDLARFVEPHRRTFGWFRAADPASFAIGSFPCFTLLVEEGHFYGFPRWQHPGVKFGGPHGGLSPCDPETFARQATRQDVDALRDVLHRYVPSAAGDPLAVRVCFYSVTPDEHFVIDRLPGAPQIIVASACSGHGYKFSPALGEVLADLACGETPPYDLSLFSLDRFRPAA